MPTRRMIATSTNAIRVAGLSGVGKTRFVQALFDENIGTDVLDRTTVIYADTGANSLGLGLGMAWSAPSLNPWLNALHGL